VKNLMNITLKVTCLTLALTIPSLAENPAQDTSKAEQYFANELDFKTNPYGVKKALENKESNIAIIDVRASKDFAAGHIPGAISIPYDKYNFDGSDTEFPGLKKDGYNYVYCYKAECNLAQKAAKKFASLGYPVKEIVGGFQSWKNDKFPVEK